jgi:bifunctional non-homologous end joining protein LigD
MNATAELKSVSLYYREGSSDKEYHVRIEESGAGYLVNFAYGRRGSALSTGTKTTSPVDLPTAERLYDKLVKEKKAKGYTEGESGTPYQHHDNEANHESDLHPQLLNSVDEAEVERLLDDPDWFMQEKHDGRRMLLEKDGRMIIPINKKGFAISAPVTILQSAEKLKYSCVVDGEHIGDYLYVFDLLELNGEDLRAQPFEQRYIALLSLIAGSHTRHIQIVQCFTTAKDKRSWLNTFKLKKAEGVVFKDKRAPYTAGRPNSGGTQLKHKFVASLSAVVTVINPQRSVTVSLLDPDTGWHEAGNVTIPANHKIPACGAVVEVRYLYAFTQSRKMFQPVYLGERRDVDQIECTMAQLKFKAEEEE